MLAKAYLQGPEAAILNVNLPGIHSCVHLCLSAADNKLFGNAIFYDGVREMRRKLGNVNGELSLGEVQGTPTQLLDPDHADGNNNKIASSFLHYMAVFSFDHGKSWLKQHVKLPLLWGQGCM